MNLLNPNLLKTRTVRIAALSRVVPPIPVRFPALVPRARPTPDAVELRDAGAVDSRIPRLGGWKLERELHLRVEG